MSTGREIRLIEEDDGWWSGVDLETGVASQGPSRADALANLDEAVELTNPPPLARSRIAPCHPPPLPPIF